MNRVSVICLVLLWLVAICIAGCREKGPMIPSENVNGVLQRPQPQVDQLKLNGQAVTEVVPEVAVGNPIRLSGVVAAPPTYSAVGLMSVAIVVDGEFRENGSPLMVIQNSSTKVSIKNSEGKIAFEGVCPIDADAPLGKYIVTVATGKNDLLCEQLIRVVPQPSASNQGVTDGRL